MKAEVYTTREAPRDARLAAPRALEFSVKASVTKRRLTRASLAEGTFAYTQWH